MSTALSTLLPLIHIPRCPEPLKLQALRNACRQFCRESEWWEEEVTADWLGANGKAILSVAGADEAGYNTTYFETGTYGGKPYYVSLDGAYAIRWHPAEYWSIILGAYDDSGSGIYANLTDSATPVLSSDWEDLKTGSPGFADPQDMTVTVGADFALNYLFANTQIIRTQWVKVDDSIQRECDWTVDHDGILTFDPALPSTADVIKANIILMPTITAASVDDTLVSRWAEAIAYGAEFHLKSHKGSEQDPTPWYDPEGAMMARQLYRDGVTDAKAEKFLKRKSGNRHATPYRRSLWT